MSIGSKISWGILFAAFALLFISTVSSPMIDHLGLGSVTSDGKTVKYGVFGYCVTTGIDKCTPRKLGYAISESVQDLTGTRGNPYPGSLDHLTYGLVMHPIATALAGISFLIAVFSDRVGFFFAACTAVVAFLASLIAMAIDLSLFGQIISKTKAYNLGVANNQFTAKYSAATWITVTATILLFIGVFINLFECMCGNKRRGRDNHDNYQMTHKWKPGV